MALNKTKTIRKRSITIYPPTQEMKTKWFEIAKKEGLSVSNFTIEAVEEYIQEKKRFTSKDTLSEQLKNLEKQNKILRNENIELKKNVDMLNMLTDRYEKQLQNYRNKTFIENGVHKILVSSPHCYHTFKNEYPEFNVNFEVIHMSQFLHQLISEGRLTLTKEYAKKVTYHDPCYLGRHNNVFDEPREVLGSVPGLEFVEMSESRKDSLCCGGGGGRIWMETPKEERFADLRLQQALDVGAEVLVTSCPYCIVNFEDSSLSLEDGEALQIKDITEIIQHSCSG